MSKTVKIVFGIPTEGHSPPEALHNRLLMAFRHGVLQTQSRAQEAQFEFFHSTAGRLFTPFAREKIAADALKLDADYIFMVDDDMLGPVDLFERLYRHQQDIVAALAFTRNPPHLAVLYEVREGYDPQLHREYVQTEWIRTWPRGKLVECDAVGFGAVLIKTDILRRMSPPYFMCSSGTGEDIWFCNRAKRQAKARVFMDTSIELGHIGAPIIVDRQRHETFNDPAEQEKLYGAYKRFGVYDICQLSSAESADKGKVEVLAL